MSESQESNANQVLREIASQRIHSSYLLWGEDSFRLKEILKKIIDLLVPEENRDFLLFSLDGGQVRSSQILAALKASPLIDGRKLVLVNDTTLLSPRETQTAEVDRIREALRRSPRKATEDFCRLLTAEGIPWEDFISGGWRSMSETQGRRLLSSEAWEKREEWLTQMARICGEKDFRIPPAGDESQELADFLTAGMPEETNLVLTAGSVDRRRRLYKVLAERGRVLSFPLEKKPSRQLSILMEAARETLIKADKEMAPGAWELLGERVDFDPLKGRQGVAKLVNYVSGRIVTVRDVEELIKDEDDAGIFGLIEATWGKKTGRALVILDRLLLSMNPVQILFHFAREIRLLLQAREITPMLPAARLSLMEYPRFQAEVLPVIKAWDASKTKGAAFLLSQHPFVIYNCLRNAPRFSKETLVSLLNRLLETDLALKTGSRDPALLLENFIVLATRKIKTPSD